jgi:hypothetical protein
LKRDPDAQTELAADDGRDDLEDTITEWESKDPGIRERIALILKRIEEDRANPERWKRYIRRQVRAARNDGPEAHQHTMVTDDDGHQWCVDCGAQFDGPEDGA